jgi:uncharacterized damage-inducible protein DinB
MNAKDLLRYNVTFCHEVTKAYLNDMTDDELLARAVPGSNHLAWQLGHLISSEQSLLAAIGAEVPDLPDGFAEKHGKENTGSNDPGDFLTKGEYLARMEQMHAAAAAAIDKTDEAELDTPSPEAMRSYFPTVGSILLMAGSHEMMHAGQMAAIRRKLGKPVVI